VSQVFLLRFNSSIYNVRTRSSIPLDVLVFRIQTTEGHFLRRLKPILFVVLGGGSGFDHVEGISVPRLIAVVSLRLV